jgi:hypothetical protein
MARPQEAPHHNGHKGLRMQLLGVQVTLLRERLFRGRLTEKEQTAAEHVAAALKALED